MPGPMRRRATLQRGQSTRRFGLACAGRLQPPTAPLRRTVSGRRGSFRGTMASADPRHADAPHLPHHPLMTRKGPLDP